jgi:hypothetical protein
VVRGDGGSGEIKQDAEAVESFRRRCDAGYGVEGEVDLFADGEAIEGMVIVFDDVGVSDGMDGGRWCDAEDVVFEEVEDLGTALGRPLLGSGDGVPLARRRGSRRV